MYKRGGKGGHVGRVDWMGLMDLRLEYFALIIILEFPCISFKFFPNQEVSQAVNP